MKKSQDSLKGLNGLELIINKKPFEEIIFFHVGGHTKGLDTSY